MSKKLFKLFGLFGIVAKADGKVTTAVTNTGDGIKFTGDVS